MKPKRILVTGASGCIGHYISESLIQETEHELYLLVRDPDKIRFDYQSRPGITIVKGDLLDIERVGNLLKTIDIAILAATSWGGSQAVFDVNVIKTIRLLNLLDPAVCEQVIYFSTASILGRDNELLKEAGELGTDYIRSKYDCLQRLSKLAIAPRVTTLFPTLVLGGDANKPYSHLSSGLPGVAKWIDLIRFFKADGSFHFMHGRDIAQVVRFLIEHPPSPSEPRQIVLGQAPMTVNEAVEEVCAYLDKKIHFRVPLSPWLADFFILLFRIQMAPWDRFCLRYRHFTYQDPVNPATLGLPNYCATFSDVLKISGVQRRQLTAKNE
ncbi:NAD(P)-dependent oxidoreductase [Coleofasciculus sp. FACHB-1120]|uniref:NAD-dependent epimerase/dehydratase family protein n=1 Tax=Coleofasciculus sp. FACHB-1120 TaxID=2692783 RepID=UPI001688F8A4|nr:NAD(P)-dependent oxidoreductase [Coleofasciculus sp. FACHB-1120]MBD2740844.1 NAD(P)-dependent oxidoreductase [Coleofasciculus sp. FACHB-1120]